MKTPPTNRTISVSSFSIPQIVPLKYFDEVYRLKKRFAQRKSFLATAAYEGKIIPHRVTYRVFLDGADVTPKPLSTIEDEEEMLQPDALYKKQDFLSKFVSALKSQSTVDDITEIIESPSLTPLSEVPSQFCLPKEIIDETMPQRINLQLRETQTIFFFELPSLTVEKDTDEGKAVEEDNEFYDFITVGKGRNRKVIDAEAQTITRISKSRWTSKQKSVLKNNSAFVSGWDLFDIINSDFENNHFNNKSERFEDAVNLVERILASNEYAEQHRKYRGLIFEDPFKKNIQFHYRLKILWTFSCDEIQNKTVTSVSWNNSNKDIIAVGYGKFYFSDENNSGSVLVWSVKNPKRPERSFYFTDPVTQIEFSLKNPNLLAVAFNTGTVKMINIAERNIVTLLYSYDVSFEPIWATLWTQMTGIFKDDEFLMTFGQDGYIHKHSTRRKTVEFIPSRMMQITRSNLELKGIKKLRERTPDVRMSRYVSIMHGTLDPNDLSIYYVTTDEGCVYKCCKHYARQYLEAFQAHSGPAYCMRFSPFCNKVYLTCGADWTVRIWIKGIYDPIVTLLVPMQSVQDAVWCPTNSTIIASVSDCCVYLWDLRRRLYTPVSVTRIPGDKRITIVQFINEGRNLMTGDVEGNIYVYSMEDMPFAPFYQVDALTQILRKALAMKPDLLKQFDKVGKLN